jgi:GNAT superfamily N-acetyltransferase
VEPSWSESEKPGALSPWESGMRPTIRRRATDSDVRVVPATPDRWDDVQRLAGDRGFSSGCWCMWWRCSSREFEERHGDGLRGDMAALVAADERPGLLAYAGDDPTPVGWVALGPRSAYPRLNRSRKLGPVDDRPVWSITCFYIHRRHRGSGVATALLAAAVDHARSRGAEIVEAYPIDTAARSSIANADLYTGTLAMFERAGFSEVARRDGRPIVRRVVT